MDEMDSGDESDDETVSTKMLEYISDGSQSHLKFNRREAHYKIDDCIRQIQSEWKGALKATKSMGKVFHKVFKAVVKDISQYLPPLGESSSEVSHFIQEPRNFAKVKKLSDYIKEPWLKATL